MGRQLARSTASIGSYEGFSNEIAVTPFGTPLAPTNLAARMVNAANYASGPVAPGEIVTIFGSGLGPIDGAGMEVQAGIAVTSLAGTRLLFDGIAAPLLYVRSERISAVAPYGIASRTSTNIQVDRQGTLSAGTAVPVTTLSPGIFTLDSSGAGPGAILNQDGTINSAGNPAEPSSIVVIYAEGAGRMNPTVADGSITYEVAVSRSLYSSEIRSATPAVRSPKT